MSSPTPKRKIGSRSCDACKIRKVKCTQVPCERCVAIGIECTFNKKQAPRGPRSLRAKTLQQIREAQQQIVTSAKLARQQEQRLPSPDRREISVESLVLRLCIYRLRLFPVWPIVAVEDVIAALQRDADDLDTRVLAVAIGAATMAQLKLDRFKDTDITDDATASSMEAECQRLRDVLPGRHVTLNTIRTAFFLHIYHENQQPGGVKSLLYLREAITLAQIMGLHRPSSYLGLDPAEDRLWRRMVWLLFVTERGVAMLHKLPIVLRPAEKLPPLYGSVSSDEANILPAFKKLVNLFWIFDQSRAFDIIQASADQDDSDLANPELIKALQRKLQSAPLEMDSGSNDIQKADICVTRQWMQVLLWRATLNNWNDAIEVEPSPASLVGPLQIAQEFLDFITQIPSTALEAHGPAIEFKVFEIASAVADSLSNPFTISAAQQYPGPGDVLARLQRILATTRGGNNNLLHLLANRIALSARPYSPPNVVANHHAQIAELSESESDESSGWPVNPAVDSAGQPSPRSLSEQTASWLSLVAAAELQEGANSLCSGHLLSRPEHSGEAGWYPPSLYLLGQLYNGMEPPATTPGGCSIPSGDTLAEMMANSTWLPGFVGPRSG